VIDRRSSPSAGGLPDPAPRRRNPTIGELLEEGAAVLIDRFGWSRFPPVAVEVLRALGDLPVAVDVVVTTLEELARRGRVNGDALRAALREGKVVYERP
jgi:hypothetical protein